MGYKIALFVFSDLAENDVGWGRLGAGGLKKWTFLTISKTILDHFPRSYTHIFGTVRKLSSKSTFWHQNICKKFKKISR